MNNKPCWFFAAEKRAEREAETLYLASWIREQSLAVNRRQVHLFFLVISDRSTEETGPSAVARYFFLPALYAMLLL